VTINSGGSIEQVVERANRPAGTYTLSWTGTATGRVYNTGATPPSYAASPITVTLDGSANVEVEFTASGGTKTLSKVQLEAGSTATAFRRNANSIEGELAACQRYAYRTQGTVFNYHGQGSAQSSTVAVIVIPQVTTFRDVPSSLDFSNLALYDGSSIIAVTNVTLSTGSRNLSAVAVTVASGLTVNRPYFLISNNSTNGFLQQNAEL
jgi:hypothetical protein